MSAIEQFQKARYSGNSDPIPRSHHISALSLIADQLTCIRGERRLFDGLSLKVAAGQMLLLTGANGVGKSSLLRILAGLLRPDAGAITIAAGDIEGREAIDYLGHDEGLRAALTASENLTFLKALLGGKERGLAVEEAMVRLDVSHLALLPVAVLSAGQKRRIALAGLLAVGRPIWLLDEPTSSLDAEGAALAARLFSDHCAGGGIVIAATHLPLGVDAAELRLGSVAAHAP